MALMEDNADSFQQQPTRNVMDPPPAYPGTPEVKHNPDDFFVEDEGTFTSYICSNITGSFCIFTAAQSNELLAKELIWQKIVLFPTDDEEGSDTDVALSNVTLPSTSPIPQTPPTPNRSSTSNIHLWQFVKELLNEPHLHSGCIHWVDRDKGIFKIVDSVRVAQLWGKRKNRPAMNYDKLSRSLRQYYKKGIMKKTERTQRLVYQFCSPYHL